MTDSRRVTPTPVAPPAIRRAQQAVVDGIESLGLESTTTVYKGVVGTSLAGQTTNQFCRNLADAANALEEVSDTTKGDVGQGADNTRQAVLTYGVARGCVFTQG